MTRSQRIGLFLNVTQRIPFVKYDSNGTFFFFKYDTKNWTFFWVWLKEWNFFSKKNRLTELNLFSSNMTQRIEPFISWIWRLELDLFSKYDSKSWTIFENSLDMTQRFELILLIWLEEMNSFWNMTHRIEPFFFEFDSQNWNLFLNITERIELLFLTRLEELSFFLNTTQRIEHFWIRLKEFNTLLIWLKDFFQKKKTTQRIEPFFKIRLKVLFFVKKIDSKNWTLSFLVTTQRIELFFFWNDSKNWTYFQYGSKYWIFQTKIMTQRTHFLFFFEKKNMTQRIEPFF